jgi:membrane protein CcdC involved in cytochrome C biogenesis
MHGQPADAGAWTFLAPLLILAVVLLRNARARTLRMERLWIGPAIIGLMAVMTIAAAPPRTPNAVEIDLAALVIGAGLGWWRGRASRFTLDPQTHVVTSRVSPAGMLLILGIVGLRYALRYFLGDQATALHVTAVDLADAFLLLAVGVISAQRIEWFLRARRMIAEAKAAAA